MRTLILILAILLLGAHLAAAGDTHAAPADAPRATDCQTAMDQVDDLVSMPVADVALTDTVAARLAEGLALCRSGRTAEGAKLMRHTLRALRASDTAQGYWINR